MKSSGQTSGHAFRIPGRNDQNFWSAICCGHQNSVGTYLAVANRPWWNHHICFGQPGPGLPNLQVSVSPGRPTLPQILTLGEVSEPPAHLQVEIRHCQTAGFQLAKRPRRAQQHWTGRALARLLPVGGSYSIAFSPLVAIPDVWLLCLRQGDLGWTPSGPQVGAG